MPEFAPGFEGGSDKNVLPKNTQPLTNTLVKNALVGTTVGAAAGTLTTANKARRKHPVTVNEEAKPTIETEALINRNSTAADVTRMKTVFTKKKPSFTMPRDLSGNGGPAFVRT